MNLYADLRWPAFAERYADDLAAFARDVCNVTFPATLAPALTRIERPACRVVLHNADQQSDQGLALAVVALWHLTTRPGSFTRIASPAARACQTNLAIKQLLALMLTGSCYWVARSIKHRASGWVVDGRTKSFVELVKVSVHSDRTQVVHGTLDVLWLVEGGNQMPSPWLEAMGECVKRPGNGLVIACDWYVPQFILRMVEHEGWPLIDLERTSAPTQAQRQARYHHDLREFVELVAGKRLTPHQSAVLADLAQRAPLAQTSR